MTYYVLIVLKVFYSFTVPYAVGKFIDCYLQAHKKYSCLLLDSFGDYYSSLKKNELFNHMIVIENLDTEKLLLNQKIISILTDINSFKNKQYKSLNNIFNHKKLACLQLALGLFLNKSNINVFGVNYDSEATRLS